MSICLMVQFDVDIDYCWLSFIIFVHSSYEKNLTNTSYLLIPYTSVHTPDKMSTVSSNYDNHMFFGDNAFSCYFVITGTEVIQTFH
jgi:hypothetical protein